MKKSIIRNLVLSAFMMTAIVVVGKEASAGMPSGLTAKVWTLACNNVSCTSHSDCATLSPAKCGPKTPPPSNNSAAHINGVCGAAYGKAHKAKDCSFCTTKDTVCSGSTSQGLLNNIDAFCNSDDCKPKDTTPTDDGDTTPTEDQSGG